MAIIYSCDHPESVIQQQLRELRAGGAEHSCFAVAYTYCAYYLPENTEFGLLGLLSLTQVGDRTRIHAAILKDTPTLREEVSQLSASPQSFTAFAYQNKAPWLDLQAPLNLAPVHIPKPWGQEIWYTGIEVRGQSAVIANGFATPLSWILSLMPDALAAGFERELILLKILDPLPDEVYGDLYFEMHEQKQEVYIVTHIDSQAYPVGKGAIRLGFNAEIRAHYATDEEFKQAYLLAVNDYRAVRTRIDTLFDQKRLALGIELSAPLPADTLKTWHADLPADLVQEELERRQCMDKFTALHPLQLGEVVKVPCHVPHALQHGVRTVEFQTPVYERKILSFAQKVLTQSGWDTEQALKDISVDTPVAQPMDVLYQQQGVLLEQIARFDDFHVCRLTLEPHQPWVFVTGGNYAVLLLISGSLTIEGAGFDPRIVDHSAENNAFLLPAVTAEYHLESGREPAIVLLAMPATSSRV